MSALSFLLHILLQAGISGSVIDAGAPNPQPLFNARVELARDSASPVVVRTDENGRFAFANVGSGKYRLSVTSDGFLRKGMTVTIAAGQQRNDFRIGLDAAPNVVGRVRDPNNIAVANVLVEALKVVFGPRGDRSVLSVGSALTDDRGEYHLYWLDPGDYYIRASTLLLKPGETIPGNPQPESKGPTYAPTYYPGSRDPKEATAVHLRINSNFNGLDFKLLIGSMVGISGKIFIDVTGVPVGTTIIVSPVGETASSQQYKGRSAGNAPTVPEKDRGGYAVGGMPPGTYVVSAQYTSEGQLLTVHRKTTLKLSQTDFNLRLSPGSTIIGRISVESGAVLDLRSAHVALESVDPDLPSPAIADVDSNGLFSLVHVEGADYALRILDLPGDAYMKSVRSGNLDILAKPLCSDCATPEPIRVVLGTDGGRLDGVVMDSINRPYSDAQVVLVPDAARRSFPDQFRVATSDDDGRFTLRGIPPGEYKLFAWQNLESNAYMSAVYMEGYEILGMPVAILPSSTGTTQVRLIPMD